MVNELVKDFAAQHRLTPRETDIIQLLVQQVVWLKDVAKALNVSPHTVNNHFKSIFEKTKSNSRTELIAMILQLALTKFGTDSQSMRTPHVVVIDDEKDICEILTETLSAENMRVESYTNARDFLDRLPYSTADVIISDIRMPDLSGIELLAEVKKSHRLNPSVIFISGYTGDYVESDLMNLGAVALLDKPIDNKKLQRLILEQFALNRNARSQALVQNKSKTILLNHIFPLNKENIGVGGIWLKLGEELNEEELNKIKVGSSVELKFRLGEDKDVLSATGEVVWKQFDDKQSDYSNLGIKFLDISEDVKQRLKNFVTRHNILSFIPSGRFADKTNYSKLI